MLIIDNRYKIDNEKDEDLQIDKLYRAKDLQLDSDAEYIDAPASLTITY